MKQITILTTGLGLLLIAEFSRAKYILVDIGDDADDNVGAIEGTIHELGLDLSDSAKDPKGI